MIARAEEADEALRAVRKTEASREAFLLKLQEEAAENFARISTQQRRLEELTAENTKLRKESAKLRTEITGMRMAAFEQEKIENEMRVAKEAVEAMQAQIGRLHRENAALRVGKGVEAEIEGLKEELNKAAEALEEERAAFQSRCRFDYKCFKYGGHGVVRICREAGGCVHAGGCDSSGGRQRAVESTANAKWM